MESKKNFFKIFTGERFDEENHCYFHRIFLNRAMPGKIADY